MKKLSEFFQPALSLFYPPICEGCGVSVEWREYLCGTCLARAPRIVPPFCAKCSEPFSGAISSSFSCSNCANQTLHFEAAVAAYRARGIVRRLIHEFKYHQREYLRHVISDWLAELINDGRIHPAHRTERMQNLRNAFRLRTGQDVQGSRVLLVDDVLTTGSTLSECARVLKNGGATSVYAATAARA